MNQKHQNIVLIFTLFTFCLASEALEPPKVNKNAPAMAISEDIKRLEDEVNKKCANDSKVMGCGGMILGKGLMKCFNDYIAKHKDFEYAPDCQKALNNNFKFRKK
ncbi:MAG: hypothetical protein K2Q18_15615 [Bdellovibrionales bacterium]|nr:hypothetical protein [Bdellovibrionales bacterium]